VVICPFHDDRNPSFAVYAETNTFHCFGCFKHGDVITFLREGRFFEIADRRSESPVAIVNESFANRNFPGRSAIGARFQYGQLNEKGHWYTIVGVVKEIREVGMAEKLRPAVYRLHDQTDQVGSLPNEWSQPVCAPGRPVDTISLVNVVNGDDVGMMQRGSCFGLLNKTALALRVGDFLRRKHFDGGETIQMSIMGLEDNAHPTLTELLENAIVRNGFAKHDQPD